MGQGGRGPRTQASLSDKRPSYTNTQAPKKKTGDSLPAPCARRVCSLRTRVPHSMRLVRRHHRQHVQAGLHASSTRRGCELGRVKMHKIPGTMQQEGQVRYCELAPHWMVYRPGLVRACSARARTHARAHHHCNKELLVFAPHSTGAYSCPCNVIQFMGAYGAVCGRESWRGTPGTQPYPGHACKCEGWRV